MLRLFFPVVLFVGFVSTAQAQVSGFKNGQPIASLTPTLPLIWTLEEVIDGSVPDDIIPDNREQPDNGLPDGRIAVAERENDIEEAWYSEPTTRYAHAVLGDAIEAGAVKIKTPRGEIYTFRLPRTEVFEDITPRIVDLDGNGSNEVVTILSSRFDGASIAVFGLVGNAFIKVAQSPFIGRSNRWLNIAGIERYSGRRNLEIAIVEKPHLSGQLKLYSFDSGRPTLNTRGQVPGFSNHEIGSGELRLSASADIDGDRLEDLIVPSLDRRTIYILSLARGNVKLLSRIDLPAAVDRAILVEQDGPSTTITVGLDDEKIYRITSQ